MHPTLESFWCGSDKEDRRKTYIKEYKSRQEELEINAAETHRRICAVVTVFEAETGISLPGYYSSGWRPAAVNEATSNAGKKSTHLDANAGDTTDTPDGDFTWWCMRNRHVLETHGLWMEHGVATVLLAKNTPWCHLQRVPPKSHQRLSLIHI